MSTEDRNQYNLTPKQETVELPRMSQNVESQLKSNSDHYNAATHSRQLIHEEYNSGKNLAIIERLIDEGRARDIEDEPKAKGVPVFLIGSGPSLDDSIEKLREWKGGIICSPSHALTLMFHGIQPTHIMALDPFESWSEIVGVDWSKTRTKLVTHPGVWPDLFENWPNEILLYRQNPGRADSYYATTQRNMYSKREGGRDKSIFNFMIRTEMVVFACSPPLQLFVADRLGYGIVFLAGCDFGFHSGKGRFTSYTVKMSERVVQTGNAPAFKLPIEWEKHESPFDPATAHADPQNGLSDNGLYSSAVHLYYKKNMISAWRLYGRTIYTTDHGTVTEMPYMSINEVVSTQGRKAKERKPAWNHKTAERYLAKVGAYIVENESGGKNFIESADPEVELYNFMMNMSRQYECELCHSIGAAEDSRKHDGEECPVCKQGKIKQRNVINVEKNMARTRGLLKWVENHGGLIPQPTPQKAGDTTGFEKSGDAQSQVMPSAPPIEPTPAGD